MPEISVIQLWVAALRENKLVARKMLRETKDGAIHLSAFGVLCDLYATAHPNLAKWDGDVFVWGEGLRSRMTVLPTVVAEWVGLPERDQGKYRDRSEVINSISAQLKGGAIIRQYLSAKWQDRPLAVDPMR